MGQWLNRDIHLRNKTRSLASGAVFSLVLLSRLAGPRVSPDPCNGACTSRGERTVARGVLLLAAYSAGLAVPFLLTALGIGQFLRFYQRFRVISMLSKF